MSFLAGARHQHPAALVIDALYDCRYAAGNNLIDCKAVAGEIATISPEACGEVTARITGIRRLSSSRYAFATFGSMGGCGFFALLQRRQGLHKNLQQGNADGEILSSGRGPITTKFYLPRFRNR
jgi:hypothetical protein